MQLKLSFLEEAEDPTAHVWKQLDPRAKKTLVDALARSIAKAVCPELFEQSEDDDDR